MKSTSETKSDEIKHRDRQKKEMEKEITVGASTQGDRRERF